MTPATVRRPRGRTCFDRRNGAANSCKNGSRRRAGNGRGNSGPAFPGASALGGRLPAFSSAQDSSGPGRYTEPRDGMSSQPGSYTYQRGPMGNLLSANESSGRQVNWSYDGFGNRVAKTVNGATTKYLVDADKHPGQIAPV